VPTRSVRRGEGEELDSNNPAGGSPPFRATDDTVSAATQQTPQHELRGLVGHAVPFVLWVREPVTT
jgi:hypothetical protein